MILLEDARLSVNRNSMNHYSDICHGHTTVYVRGKSIICKCGKNLSTPTLRRSKSARDGWSTRRRNQTIYFLTGGFFGKV